MNKEKKKKDVQLGMPTQDFTRTRKIFFWCKAPESWTVINYST
jgi:hypothetical protein